MATAAIKVAGLGKSYRLTHGEQREGYRTLRDSIVSAVKSPFRKRATTEEFWALDDVSFEVQPGEVVGIIGRNGAGKSTLLKILSRITKPTRGHIEINGRVGSLLEVGTGFHPELTGRENVYLNGSILGMSRGEIKAKFDEIVAFAEVEKFLDTPVKRYSSGMYVRLAFAVAAHLEPEILIVDEVLAVGDAGFQQRCLDKMRECASSGRTVLLVSHQLNSVRDLCDEAIWLNGGRLRRSGAVEEVLTEYMIESARFIKPGEWTHLTNVTRRGTGQAKFRAASYHGTDLTAPVYSDGRLQIVVQFDVAAVNQDTLVAAHIYDRYGVKLIDINTMYLGQPLRIDPGVCELSFGVEVLHLTPGSYRVGLGMGSTTEHFDDITDAFPLEVLPSPVESQIGQGQGLVTSRFGFTIQAGNPLSHQPA